MPSIELTEMELREAARGCRFLQQQARADAAAQGGSSTRRLFEEAEARHKALEQKFVQACESGDSPSKVERSRRIR